MDEQKSAPSPPPQESDTETISVHTQDDSDSSYSPSDSFSSDDDSSSLYESIELKALYSDVRSTLRLAGLGEELTPQSFIDWVNSVSTKRSLGAIMRDGSSTRVDAFFVDEA